MIAFVITIVAIQIVGFDDPVDEAEESEEETKKLQGQRCFPVKTGAEGTDSRDQKD